MMATVAGCRSKPSHSRLVASLTSQPSKIHVLDDAVIVETLDPTNLTSGEAHELLLRVDASGGQTEIVRTSPGDSGIAPTGVLFTTNPGGALLEFGFDGNNRKLAQADWGLRGPVWLPSAIFAMAKTRQQPCCDIVRLSKEGRDLQRVQHVNASDVGRIFVAADGNEAFMTSGFSTQALVHIVGDSVESVTTQTWHDLVCFGVTGTHVWWIDFVEPKRYSLVALARGGGSAAPVMDLSVQCSAGCQGTSSELIYFADKRVFALDRSGATRLIAEAQRPIVAIGAHDQTVYWAEPNSSGTAWLLRSNAIHD